MTTSQEDGDGHDDSALISMLVTGGLVLVVLGVTQRRQEVATMNERMASFAQRPKRLEELEL